MSRLWSDTHAQWANHTPSWRRRELERTRSLRLVLLAWVSLVSGLLVFAPAALGEFNETRHLVMAGIALVVWLVVWWMERRVQGLVAQVALDRMLA